MHDVFAPKYTQQVICGKVKEDIGKMLRTLCEYKRIKIHEAESCKDHIYMLVSIPPRNRTAHKETTAGRLCG